MQATRRRARCYRHTRTRRRAAQAPNALGAACLRPSAPATEVSRLGSGGAAGRAFRGRRRLRRRPPYLRLGVQTFGSATVRGHLVSGLREVEHPAVPGPQRRIAPDERGGFRVVRPDQNRPRALFAQVLTRGVQAVSEVAGSARPGADVPDLHRSRPLGARQPLDERAGARIVVLAQMNGLRLAGRLLQPLADALLLLFGLVDQDTQSGCHVP